MGFTTHQSAYSNRESGWMPCGADQRSGMKLTARFMFQAESMVTPLTALTVSTIDQFAPHVTSQLLHTASLWHRPSLNMSSLSTCPASTLGSNSISHRAITVSQKVKHFRETQISMRKTGVKEPLKKGQARGGEDQAATELNCYNPFSPLGAEEKNDIHRSTLIWLI